MIVAMQDITNEDNNIDSLTCWDRYLLDFDFDGLNPTFDIKTGLEAIPLQPGNHLYVCIHFYFANNVKLCFIWNLKSNTPYGIITLENTVITGGFYLSMHTLYESLMGMIHTFVLPSLLTEGKNLPFTIFVHQLVHYMHNTLVMNDSSDKEHCPNISTLDGACDLFALAIIAMCSTKGHTSFCFTLSNQI